MPRFTQVRRFELMKKMLRMPVPMVIVLFVLLPFIFAVNQTAAEAAKVREQTATASWTKCTANNICVDTVIIATDPGSKKTLSFEETTYRKNGKVVSRRGGFATKNVKFKQDGLEKAWVDAPVKVDLCNAKDACKKAGAVHVKASWKGKGSTWEDQEAGVRLRDAKVGGSVDGKKLGNLNFAHLTEAIN
jgi:hypothetical protein